MKLKQAMMISPSSSSAGLTYWQMPEEATYFSRTCALPQTPVAVRVLNMSISSVLAHTAQTRHRQNTLVCATLSLIISFCYDLLAQWHRQNPTYCTRTRARAVNRSYLLTLLFNYYKKCLCHCAYPVWHWVCVCASRMCQPYVPACAVCARGSCL